jgi:hypothetical protein
MLRRCARRLDLHTTMTDSPSFRAAFNHNPMAGVLHSPYKEAMKEYWATPIPWQTRDYGPKPGPHDPVPLREAATMLVVAKNAHIDKGVVEAGEDNDYKVLMQFRESKGRYQKDSFVLPSAPIHLQDRDDDWAPLLYRLGVKTTYTDIEARLCAFRTLLAECNLLVVPPEGGTLAEVEGPPGPRKWHMIVASIPQQIRYLIDILDIPMEAALKSLRPFTRVQTPATEMFRYDNKAFVLPIERCPCVRYTISTVGEQLVWVSPKEAMARFETGVMEMPTPNVILMHELDRLCPTYEQASSIAYDAQPGVVTPELVHDPATNMATVLLPTDIHHSTNAKRVERRRKRQAAEQQQQEHADPSARLTTSGEDAGEGESRVDRYARFEFTKDIPWGVRSTFVNRAIEMDEEVAENFERTQELTAGQAEVLRLEYREENNKVLTQRLKSAKNPELQRYAKLLPQDDEDKVEVERIPVGNKQSDLNRPFGE